MTDKIKLIGFCFVIACYVATIGLISFTIAQLWPAIEDNFLRIGGVVMYSLSMVTCFRGIVREVGLIGSTVLSMAERENASRFLGNGSLSIKRGTEIS